MSEYKLRIIAGKWRGKKISFQANPLLRPTPDRVKETLFNWLQPLIRDADCLELFAGTASLSLESLSRGAHFAQAVELNPDSAANIQRIARELNGCNLAVTVADAVSWLSRNSAKFDIIFVDPPYAAKLIPSCLALILEHNILKPNGRIYFEYNAELDLTMFPALEILKHQQAGVVHYYLLKVNLEKV
jgi:16S rRNA (guanine966-N2)-methyltransferase